MFRIMIIVSICLLCIVFTANELVHTEITDTQGELNKDSNEIVISDIAELVDSKFINEKDTNMWKAITYRSENFSGVMLGDGGGPEPLPVTIRLGIEGLFRVYLGIYSGYSPPQIRVRLSNDITCQKVNIPENILDESTFFEGKDNVYERGANIYEVEWKEADLSGQDLILESANNPDEQPSALAYIRLVPINEISPEPDRKVLYPLTVTNDGHGIFNGPLHSCPEDLLKPFEKIPEESCMRILLWGNGCADISKSESLNHNIPREPLTSSSSEVIVFAES